MLSAPCYKVHEFGANLIGLQLTESIVDDIPFEVRSAVKKHLGEEAFVEEGKGISRYQVGLVPKCNSRLKIRYPYSQLEYYLKEDSYITKIY